MNKMFRDLFCELAAIIVEAGNEIMKIYSNEFDIELKDDDSPPDGSRSCCRQGDIRRA